MRTLAAIACLLASTTAYAAQDPARPTPSGSPETDLLVAIAQDGATYQKDMISKAAAAMSEEDYAFKPTSDVRSFGQLLAHVADSNYGFCSVAKGEKAPVSGIEKSKSTKADIQKALAESFSYCDDAFASMSASQAHSMVPFRGRQRAAIEVLIFRNYHGLLHYGNVITYMRLRGKVPPSTELTMKK